MSESGLARRCGALVLTTAVLASCVALPLAAQEPEPAAPAPAPPQPALPQPAPPAPAAPAAAPAAQDSCAVEEPSSLTIWPPEPRAIRMIEHDPIDRVELDFEVTLDKEKGAATLELRRLRVAPEIDGLKLPNEDMALEDGKPATVLLTVEDVEWPGRHAATICLMAKSGAEVVAARKLEVEIDVRTRPRVAALQSDLELDLVKCRWLGCWLAEAILPDATAISAWPVEIRNDSLAPVAIEPQVRLRRNEKEASWPLFALRPAAGQGEDLGVGATGRYVLDVATGELRPGSYEGSLAFLATPRDEEPWRDKQDERGVTRNRTETLVTTAVNVRAGVLWPIVLIALGIVAGRLNQQIGTPEAQARLKLMERWVDLGEGVKELETDSRPRLFCEARMVMIRLQLDDPSVANDAIGDAISVLERQVRLFRELDRLYRRQPSAGAREQIAEARKLVQEGKLDEAEQKLAQISAPAPPVARDARQAKGREAEAGEVRRVEWRLAWIMSWIAGTRVASMRVRYLYFQPAATLLLLLALIALGLFTFYSGPENSTFGAALIDDYAPLFLWGFGSNVLARRLQNFTFSR